VAGEEATSDNPVLWRLGFEEERLADLDRTETCSAARLPEIDLSYCRAV
jgi:hypothetical protein